MLGFRSASRSLSLMQAESLPTVAGLSVCALEVMCLRLPSHLHPCPGGPVSPLLSCSHPVRCPALHAWSSQEPVTMDCGLRATVLVLVLVLSCNRERGSPV